LEKDGREFQLKVIGWIESYLTHAEKAPRKARFRAGSLAGVEPEYVDGLDGIQAGDQLLVFTQAAPCAALAIKLPPHGNHDLRQGCLRQPIAPPPKSDWRSRVTVQAVEGKRLRLRDMEAVNGTPVVDIKCVLD
jgi:tRNA (Thr-GGU) A37 N-methylase